MTNINPFTSKLTSSLALPFAIGVTLAVYPLASLSHGKGIYDSKADAEKRAIEIGCTAVHQNNGKWMPCADEKELHRQLRKQ